MIMGKREVRQIRLAVRRLAGQSRGSPSGELAHWYARIRRAISPSPGKVSTAASGLSPLLMASAPHLSVRLPSHLELPGAG